jgi:glutamine---fructose-6-phosphate transaminase (isomerizing)
MTMSNLAQDILGQGQSLACALQYQCGEGATALTQAASLLRSRSRVLITGIGASLFASIPLEYSLCSLGIDAVAIEAGELLHYRHDAFGDAVAVIVSRSGESIEVSRLLAILKGRQPIIGISNEPQSLLAQSADVSINISSRPDEMVAIQTYTGTLLALHLLFNAVTNSMDAAREMLKAIQPEFCGLVESNMDARFQWDAFFKSDSPVHLLARGPSCASAFEGALLFNEVAKSPAIGMATASFRHGPVEIVDSDFKSLVFAPRGRTGELNLALARDLAEFGGDVRVIGPSPQPLLGAESCTIPDVPEALAPLFQIIPVQAAALRLAELRGIAPGSFRYAPQVAVDEARFGRLRVS